MACFTEIVMSPVRLFTEGTASAEQENDDEPKDVNELQVEGVARRRPTHVQRLRFDTEAESQQPDSSLGSRKLPDSDATSASDSLPERSDSSPPKSDSHLRLGDKKEPGDSTVTDQARPEQAFESLRDSRELVTQTPEGAREMKPNDEEVMKKVHTSNGPEMPSGSKVDGTNLNIRGCFEDSGPTQDPEVSQPSSGILRVTRQDRKQPLEGRMYPKTQNEAEPRSLSSETKAARRRHTPAPKRPPGGKNGANTRRVGDPYVDQGMSMSLMLKVGPVAGEHDGTTSCKMMMLKDGIVGDEPGTMLELDPERVLIENECGFESHAHFSRTVSKSDKLRRRCVPSETRTLVESRPAPNRLKRSLSCPDISSLGHADHAPALHPPSPKRPAHPCSPLKRERRHTVCSLEVEREIAPLCLRKEVFPNWPSVSGSTPPRSPSRSLAVLVSRFLSSPLAFLSQRSGPGRGGHDGRTDQSFKLSAPSPLVTAGLFPDVPHTLESGISSHSR